MSVTEEKTFWVENNGFEIANPWELDTLGNYPWDTLGIKEARCFERNCILQQQLQLILDLG